MRNPNIVTSRNEKDSDDKENANLLNSYFKTQSDLNDAGKELPYNQTQTS